MILLVGPVGPSRPSALKSHLTTTTAAVPCTVWTRFFLLPRHAPDSFAWGSKTEQESIVANTIHFFYADRKKGARSVRRIRDQKRGPPHRNLWPLHQSPSWLFRQCFCRVFTKNRYRCREPVTAVLVWQCFRVEDSSFGRSRGSIDNGQVKLNGTNGRQAEPQRPTTTGKPDQRYAVGWGVSKNGAIAEEIGETADQNGPQPEEFHLVASRTMDWWLLWRLQTNNHHLDDAGLVDYFLGWKMYDVRSNHKVVQHQRRRLVAMSQDRTSAAGRSIDPRQTSTSAESPPRGGGAAYCFPVACPTSIHHS
jgi:hypothetical protein